MGIWDKSESTVQPHIYLRVVPDSLGVRTKTSLCDVLVACIRVLHYFGQEITDPVHICVSYGCLKIHARPPYGPLKMLFGLGNCRTINRFGLHTALSGCQTGLDQSCRAVLGQTKIVNTPTGYTYRAKLNNVWFYPYRHPYGPCTASQDCRRDFYGHKITGNPFLKLVHAELLANGHGTNKNQKWDPLRAMKIFIRRKVGHTT